MQNTTLRVDVLTPLNYSRKRLGRELLLYTLCHYSVKVHTQTRPFLIISAARLDYFLDTRAARPRSRLLYQRFAQQPDDLLRNRGSQISTLRTVYTKNPRGPSSICLRGTHLPTHSPTRIYRTGNENPLEVNITLFRNTTQF